MPTKDKNTKATAILGMPENLFNSMSKYLKLPVKTALFVQTETYNVGQNHFKTREFFLLA